MLIQLILAHAGSNRVAILTAVVSMCSDLGNVGSSQQQDDGCVSVDRRKGEFRCSIRRSRKPSLRVNVGQDP